MRPAIEPGQTVLLRCTNDVAIGDIVAVAVGSDVIVHRLVAAAPGRWWLLRGDHNVLCDVPLIDPAAIIGKVIAVERSDGSSFEPPPVTGRIGARFVTRATTLLLAINIPLARWITRLAVALRRTASLGVAAVRGSSPL